MDNGMKGPKGWLKSSYNTHGNSTSQGSKPKMRNMDDTPKAKVVAAGKKNTEADPAKFGNKSGGGGRQLSTKSPDGRGSGNVKYMSGIVGSRKQ